MRRIETRIAGLVLLELTRHADERGLFVETYRRDSYVSLGIQPEFIQDNHSRSTRGAIRGLHYQVHPGQAKLIRAVRGAIWDVVVDLRQSSATFGEHESFLLDDSDLRELFVPVGFAHGFCVLSDEADVTYKVSSYYDAEAERGIAFDDPDLAIRWPSPSPVVSERDRGHPRLAETLEALPAW